MEVPQDKAGRGMKCGEIASMTAIQDAVHSLASTPIAWGAYASDTNVHLFLCSFHDMTDDIPDIGAFPSKVANLHEKGLSRNGKCGFPVTTYQGRLPQETR